MPVAIRPTLTLDYTMTTVGVTENVNYTATRPMAVIDVHNACIVADAASTTGVLRQALGAGAFTAVCTALVCAVAGVVTRVTVGYDIAQAVLVATDVLRVTFTATNSTLNARCWVTVTPLAIVGTAPGYTGGTGQATNLT